MPFLCFCVTLKSIKIVKIKENGKPFGDNCVYHLLKCAVNVDRNVDHVIICALEASLTHLFAAFLTA